ncbi:YeiH family protein [Synechococcus sp. MIT S1220]|uniref:YeiH family protein n=1 Tax=Synechococcus sp. MIT S1220 TaxID=3082549 RepID=UPI0039B07D01
MIFLLAFALNFLLQIVLNNIVPQGFLITSIFLQPVFLSLLAGVFLRQRFRCCRYSWIRQAEYLSSKFLSLALILLGAKFVVADFLIISPKTIIFLVVSILATCICSSFVSKILGIRHHMMLWLIAGNCICGPTAISFAAQVFHGEKNDIAKAIWINTLIGFILMLLLPILGLAFDLDTSTFGVWVGASLQSTAQVVTSAAMYSSDSSELALMIKSIRILFLVPLISFLFLFFRHSPIKKSGPDYLPSNQSLNVFEIRKMIPKFMVGFAILAFTFFMIDTIAFTFNLSKDWIGHIALLRRSVANLSNIFLAMAMFGIGFLCNFEFKREDLKVILFAFCSAIQLVIFAYLVALI